MDMKEALRIKKRADAALIGPGDGYKAGMVFPIASRADMDPDELSTDIRQGEVSPGQKWAMPGILAEMGNDQIKAAQMMKGERAMDPLGVGMAALDLSAPGVVSTMRKGPARGAMVNMFGGAGAKTADLDKMRMAQALLDGGADRADVWRQTGWFKGPDGKMRFEIDDSAASLNPGGLAKFKKDPVGRYTPVDSMVEHKNLTDSYPDIIRNQHSIRKGDGFGEGSWDGADFELASRQPDDMKSAFLHEGQHYIQGQEGFASGGAAERLSDITPESLRPTLDRMRREFESLPGGSPERIAAWERWKDLGDQYTPHGQYKRLAGEAEARNVQTRMDMTPEQRLAEPPWTTMDVPEADQIVRMGDGGVQEANVWQGGPHKYGREGAAESLQHIGKGEGATAYGWGRYDAGAREVAEQYRKQLSPRLEWEVKPETLTKEMADFGFTPAAIDRAKKAVTEHDSDGFKAIAELDALSSNRGDRVAKEAASILRSFHRNVKDGGSLYKHDLPDDDIARYMDWDKPLSEQPENVRAAMQKAFEEAGIPDAMNRAPDGQSAYAWLSSALARGESVPDAVLKQRASEALGRAGIPGLQYYDGMSRNAGEGTRNYVTWDQDVLDRMKLLERNGENMALPMDEASRMAKQERIAALRAEANANRSGASVEDYAGIHRPPMRDSGAPAHDLTGGGTVYPDDIYSANAVQYYGTGNPGMDRDTVRILKKLKNNPDEMVSIYRAGPSSAKGSEISAGDWVTVNRNYAKEHGEGTLRGDYAIVERKVRAKDIYTNGDSIHEFGFDPARADSPDLLASMTGTPELAMLANTLRGGEPDLADEPAPVDLNQYGWNKAFFDQKIQAEAAAEAERKRQGMREALQQGMQRGLMGGAI